MQKKSTTKKTHKKGGVKSPYIILIAALVIILFAANAVDAFFAFSYRSRIYPGVRVGQLSLGGLSRENAEGLIQKTIDELKNTGLTFCYEQQCIIAGALAITPTDPDLSYDIFTADVENIIDDAYAVGRKGFLFERLLIKRKLMEEGVRLSANWNIDISQLTNILTDRFGALEERARNADIAVKNENEIKVTPSATGWRFNYETAISKASEKLANFERPVVVLEKVSETPKVTLVNEGVVSARARHLLKIPQWKVTYEDKIWEVPKNERGSLLTLTAEEKGINVGLREEALLKFIETAAGDIEQQAKGAKFVLQGSRVVEFQGSKDGRAINRDETLKEASRVFISATTTDALVFPLIVEVTESKQSTDSVNNLGIKEIIGVGKSNFKGSPKNRRHNIKVGADTLNGILITPGEEFSLVKALGEINKETGYLPELVIKGNRTIPEYGGGLCQIGTTIFRATLASGLPILERKNHSFRVRYYEPAGTDATIYGPKPDYRFLNDTGYHILIQTRIEGDDLIFEFWGTKDGRVAEQTKPVIYNITAPKPTQYIETADLPVGEVKCTEHAVPGADTSFDYKVTYPSGEVKETTFKSHYIPWQEVCLIGVPPEKLIQNPISATSTAAIGIGANVSN